MRLLIVVCLVLTAPRVADAQFPNEVRAARTIAPTGARRASAPRGALVSVPSSG